jgi:predicted ATPase
MTGPRIRAVRIDGHTSMRDVEVTLGDINVLVGANGSGKSNFINALELLGRVADNDLQLYVEVGGGARRLLTQSPTPADTMRLRIDAEHVHYEANLIATADDRLVYRDEGIAHSPPERGWPHSRVQWGTGARESYLHRYVKETRPKSTNAISTDDIQTIIDVLGGCRVFHFQDTSVHAPVKQRQSTADNLTLRPHAENLAPVLMSLRDNDEATYRRILRTIQLTAPFFRDFILEPEGTDYVRLRWRPNDSDAVFSAHQLSDGTLRFICLTTLLLHPVKPRLIVLDEPELGLHPFAIAQLADMLRAAAATGQVVVATQSVTLLDQMELDDVIVVELRDGVSHFSRPDREALTDWLTDYSLGDLWLKNLIGGRPVRDAG